MNVIGIDWPHLNEDAIRSMAQLMREFGQAVEQTHQDATLTVGSFAQAYQGALTAVMHSGWTQLSAAHVNEIIEGCGVLADALEVGADYVVRQKVQAAVQLGIMAAEFVADQAASVFTVGLAEAAVPAIIALGKPLVETLKQQIIQTIMGDVIKGAAKPLFTKIEYIL